VEKYQKDSAPGPICSTVPAWNLPLIASGAVGGVDKMAEHADSGTGRPLAKGARGQADDRRAVEKPTDEEKAPLEFACLRLRQKLMVRQAIRDTPSRKDPVRQGTADRGRRSS